MRYDFLESKESKLIRVADAQEIMLCHTVFSYDSQKLLIDNISKGKTKVIHHTQLILEKLEILKIEQQSTSFTFEGKHSFVSSLFVKNNDGAVCVYFLEIPNAIIKNTLVDEKSLSRDSIIYLDVSIDCTQILINPLKSTQKDI